MAPFCEDGDMGRLLMLRHAQSVWNAAGRWQGWSDAPLSPLGESQARQAGRVLAHNGVVAAIVASSDLQRAHRTATLIAGEIGYGGPVQVDAGLREHDVGEWNGLTTDQINARWPGQVEALGARGLEGFPGGEVLSTFYARVQRAALRLARLAHEQQHGDVIVVSHGGAMTALEHWLGVWRRERRHPNLSGWWFALTGRPPEVELQPLSCVQLLPTASGPLTPGAGAPGPGGVGMVPEEGSRPGTDIPEADTEVA